MKLIKECFIITFIIIIFIFLFFFQNFSIAKEIEKEIEADSSIIISKILENKVIKDLYKIKGLRIKELEKEGDYYIFFNKEEESLILIHNGTEILRLNKEQTKKILKKYPNLFTLHKISQGNINQKVSNFNLLDNRLFTKKGLLKTGKWDEYYLKWSVVTGIGRNKIITGFLYNDIGFFKSYNIIYLGMGIEFKNYYGGTEKYIDSVYTFLDNKGLYFQFGTNWFKMKIINYNYKLPDFFFVDSNYVEAVFESKESDYLSLYKNSTDTTLKSNWLTSFSFKFGYFTYTTYSDMDVYKTNISRVFLDNLPSGFGTWGVGYYKFGDNIIPSFYMRVGNFTLKSIGIKGKKLQIANNMIVFQLDLVNMNFFRSYIGTEFYLY